MMHFGLSGLGELSLLSSEIWPEKQQHDSIKSTLAVKFHPITHLLYTTMLKLTSISPMLMKHMLPSESKLTDWLKDCTWWEVFINGPVIHLQCSIPTISGETDNVILPIIHWGAAFLHTDIHCANVEGHSNFALLLKWENAVIKTRRCWFWMYFWASKNRDHV